MLLGWVGQDDNIEYTNILGNELLMFTEAFNLSTKFATLLTYTNHMQWSDP